MKFIHYCFFISLISVSSVFGQSFGKNKVIYRDFDWSFIQSKHFDIYFYEGGLELAQFTAEVAESAYVQIKRDWQYDVKERIVFIVYRSHNDWQQTNVVLSYLQEGIQGVTELFKNRIVVPFEGSYDLFRHVIHHELVHGVMNDMLYGGSIQSLIVGEATQVPLWFAEGLAEFQSVGWSIETDMIVRDAVLNNYIPNLQSLEYFLAYQGGNSVFRYIASKYGRKKVGEILQKMRGKVIFERVLRSSLGVGYEEFTEEWHRYLKKHYWPEVADRKEPVEISKRLTDHEKVPNFLNVSPTISPNGDKVAFISDRRGTQNIYLISAIDGRMIKTLVKGQRSRDFEELQFLRPGMSFSPDGKRLVLSAKAGARDAIYLIDVKSGKTKKYNKLKLDGIFTATWSPDGEKIAFIGNKNNQSDLYLLDLSNNEVTQLTNDVFTDDHPSWSPDSRKIAFVSDRKGYTNTYSGSDFQMAAFDYESQDIYVLDVNTRLIEQVTDTPWKESNPLFSPDGKTLAYVSQKNGIPNLFLHKLESDEAYPVTNIISGVLQVNWDRYANKLVFTSFFKGGYDIFVLNNPLELPPVELQNTYFVDEMRSDELPVYARDWQPNGKNKVDETEAQKGDNPAADYSRYVFSQFRSKPKEEKKDIKLAQNTYQDEDGNYKVRRYKLKFSPDIITGSAGYNTFFGFSGYTTFAFSDLLGDHKILLNVNLVSDLKNSDLSALYLYLEKRMAFGIGGYQQAWFFSNDGRRLQRYRNYGVTFLTSYPFSKFTRLEVNVNWFNVKLEDLTFDIPDEKVSTILPSLSYVHDTVLWGYTGPVDGTRYALTFTASPKYEENSREFSTGKLDYRKYFMLNRNYSFAFRLAGGASFGENPQRFFLGGLDNWINYKTRFRNNSLRTDNIDDIFFSEFVTPLRGAFFYEKEGSRYLLTNLEFHFPLIQFLGLGFPPLRLFNIRGAMFADVGSAWDDNSLWRGTTTDEFGNRKFKDIVAGYGVGARIFFLYFLMRIDVAWRYDLDGSSKPIWYISLGGDI